MKAPIPDRESFWWNDTGGICKMYPPQTDMRQDEGWWTDEQLDRKAASIIRQHISLRRSSPYFMETEVKDYSETNADGQWLSDAEVAKLQNSEQFTIHYNLATEIVESTIPKALLVSFSRLGKEANLLYKLGGTPFVIDDWYAYVSTWWKKDDAAGMLVSMESLPREEQIGCVEDLMKATNCFLHWSWTGRVELEVDEVVGKEYLLHLARALGAPLFRKAILEQMI